MAYEIATIGDLSGACCDACASGQSCPSSMGDVAPTEASQIVAAGFLPTIVWPSDVDAYKRKLDPDFLATNATVSTCADLSSGQSLAWSDFFGAWKKFRDEPSPIFGAANKFDEAQSYETRLQAWQALLAKTCKLHAPNIEPPPDPAEAASSSIKWIAAAVIVVGLAYVASPFIMGARKLAR